MKVWAIFPYIDYPVVGYIRGEVTKNGRYQLYREERINDRAMCWVDGKNVFIHEPCEKEFRLMQLDMLNERRDELKAKQLNAPPCSSYEAIEMSMGMRDVDNMLEHVRLRLQSLDGEK